VQYLKDGIFPTGILIGIFMVCYFRNLEISHAIIFSIKISFTLATSF